MNLDLYVKLFLPSVILLVVNSDVCRKGATDVFYFEAECTDTKSYNEAKLSCESRGGWIGEPNTAELVKVLAPILQGLTGKYFYQGLNQVDGAWVWSRAGSYADGIPPRLTSGAGGDCSVLGSAMKWNPQNCNTKSHFVCQFNGYCEAHSDACNERQSCQSTLSAPYHTCTCLEGYFGENCVEHRNVLNRVGYCESHTDPCKNGGMCISEAGQSPYYYCKCPAAHCGLLCDDSRPESYIGTSSGYYFERECHRLAPLEANSFCEDRGGWLAEPKTQLIVDGLQSIAAHSTPQCYYSALKKINDWKWRNGDVLTFTNWKGGHPNRQKCMCFDNTMEWWSVLCTDKRLLICQYDEYCTAHEAICQNGGTCQSTSSSPYFNCNCPVGYFGETCEFASISIQSTESIFGVKSESVVFFANVSSYVGSVKVDVTKDKLLMMRTEVILRNSTINYTIHNIKEESAGRYEFTAYPIDANPTYSFSTTTDLIVHVRAFIDDVTPTFIYAPPSKSPTSSKCIFGGIPKPIEYGWYRNNLEVSTSSTKNVYQTKTGNSAHLQIENAMSHDSGEYVCLVSNRVANETEDSVDRSKNVTLTVYEPPYGLEVIPKRCDTREEISIKWTPGNRTEDINHLFKLLPKNASSYHIQNMTSSEGEAVLFEGLQPEALYEIYIEVCAEHGCISKLNTSISFVASRSLPGVVENSNLTKDGNACIAEWSYADPFSSINNVTGYNVVWEAVVNEEILGVVENVTGSDLVEKDQHSYRITTLPNKKYYVSVSARNCAGNGSLLLTKGECYSQKEAPSFVPRPVITREQDGIQQATRDIIISMAPDESNGSISCLFVIIYKEEDYSPESIPQTVANLQTLSANAFTDIPAGGYIAFAITRKEIGRHSNVLRNLGNGQETSCDVYNVENRTSPRKKRSAEETTINAKAAPLEYTGTIYKMLTMTATPINDDLIKLQNSDEVTFTQGYVSSNIIYVIIPAAVTILLVVIVLVVFLRKKWAAKFKGRTVSVVLNEVFNNNIPTEGGTNDTSILMCDLKQRYLSMSANESKQFKNQHAKLKRIFKMNAPVVTFGKTPETMSKNRYVNILPYDKTRVSLTGNSDYESYINACYVQGGHKRFIAAQGPLPITTVDFWRMVVEQKCRIIVMLTKCKELGKVKCEKYWPSLNSRANFNNVTVHNISESNIGGIIKRTLKLEVSDQLAKEVVQYQFLRWPDHGVPSTTSTFLRLHKKVIVKYHSLNDAGPILVHCSAGIGRTGTFIGYDILDDETGDSTDIYRCVLKMRHQRVDMVQTSAQYQMLHKLMLENYTFKDTDIPETKLAEKIQGTLVAKEYTNLSEADSFAPQIREQSGGNHSSVAIIRQADDTERVTVNANFVDAYNDNIKLIAAEGPTTSTVEYFLRAIWDNNVDVIVMLDTLDGVMKDSEGQYASYWAMTQDEPVKFNDVTVELTMENDVRGTTERTLRVSRKGKDQRNIQQFHFREWASELPSENGAGLLDLVNRLNAFQRNKQTTVMVHCTDGLGKTGVFIAVVNLIARLEAENCVDVFRTVKDLRDIRPGMVKTLAQYKFCFQILSLYMSQKAVYENNEVVKDDVAADPIYQNL